MSATTALNVCPNIQDELVNHFNTCGAAGYREETPLFNFLLNPANTGNVNMLVSPGKSKVRTVELRWDQRINTNEVTSNVTNPTCTATTERGDYIKTYTIDTTQNMHIEQVFDMADWITICRSGGTLLAQKMQMMIDSLVRARAKKTAQEVAVLMSTAKWDSAVASSLTVNGANQLVVPTLKPSSTTDPNPLGLTSIDQAIMQTGYCTPVFMPGGTTLWKYYQLLNAGCCSTAGVDMGELMRLYGKAVAYDRDVVNATANENITWVIGLGSLALIEFSANEIYSEPEIAQFMEGANYKPMVIFDPKTGHKIDLTVSIVCGAVHVGMWSTAKAVGLPDDLFGTGDTMSGVKFINQVLVTNS